MSASIKCLNQIGGFLQLPINKITVNNDNMPTCNLQNKSVTGFVNIIITLLSESNSQLLGANLIDQAEVRQWLEYCVTYISVCNNPQSETQVLKELNKVLITKTYFVGNSLTMADVAMFYTVQNIIKKCSYLEKEKYLNVCRWYDNIQQNDNIRKEKGLVDFSTIFLSCVNVR